MAILDKLKSVGGAIKHKMAETFGEGGDEVLGDEGLGDTITAPPLDAAGARHALGVDERASLADVREAYRKLARTHYPRARREGPASAAAELLDRALSALELLEEVLLPLGGSAPSPQTPATSSRRKRATPRS
ncbi:MAG: J domain-containing protein [Deltaproteobacteria bacterium]|nr:J domain-containing protein [Deltaproteobacteria bacterium]